MNRTNETPPRAYLPAAGHDWLLPLYDPLVRLLGGDSARRALAAGADLEHAARVLDVGCGTGTLAVLLARSYPDLQVVAIDPDPQVLRRAARKAQRAGVRVRFDRGYWESLPYADASFDRVFSSLVLHHLATTDDRLKALSEMKRVVAPRGSVHVMDLAAHEGRARGWMRWVHGGDHMRDNSEARIVGLMREAGFADARIVMRRSTAMGRLAFYEASADGRANAPTRDAKA